MYSKVWFTPWMERQSISGHHFHIYSHTHTFTPSGNPNQKPENLKKPTGTQEEQAKSSVDSRLHSGLNKDPLKQFVFAHLNPRSQQIMVLLITAYLVFSVRHVTQKLGHSKFTFSLKVCVCLRVWAYTEKQRSQEKEDDYSLPFLSRTRLGTEGEGKDRLIIKKSRENINAV